MEFNNLQSYQIESSAASRTRLITKVYANLTGAVVAFAALEALVFATFGVETILRFVSENMKLVSWGLLALCLLGPMLGRLVVGSNPSRFRQYVYLGFYVVLYTALFIPLLAFAAFKTGNMSLIWQACGLTASLFAALSAAVFFTRVDFSFLRSALVFLTIAAFVLVGGALLFGFSLGTWFIVGMILLACGYVLYDTSNIMLHYPEEADVLATVALFSALMTLFYYILSFLSSRDN